MTTEALALIAQELDRAETPCVPSSFQAECVVLVHMLRQYRRDDVEAENMAQESLTSL